MKDSGKIIQFRAKESTHKIKTPPSIKDTLRTGKNREKEN